MAENLRAELKTNIPGFSIKISGEIKNIEDYHKIKDLFEEIMEEERALLQDEGRSMASSTGTTTIKQLSKENI